MKIKFNKLIPFKGFLAMNLYGVIFVRDEYQDRWYNSPMTKYYINHEYIHELQALDFCKIKWIGYTIYYIIYFFMWIKEILVPPYNKAYKDIRFEREAYRYQMDLDYPEIRLKFAEFKKEFNKNEELYK